MSTRIHSDSDAWVCTGILLTPEQVPSIIRGHDKSRQLGVFEEIRTNVQSWHDNLSNKVVRFIDVVENDDLLSSLAYRNPGAWDKLRNIGARTGTPQQKPQSVTSRIDRAFEGRLNWKSFLGFNDAWTVHQLEGLVSAAEAMKERDLPVEVFKMSLQHAIYLRLTNPKKGKSLSLEPQQEDFQAIVLFFNNELIYWKNLGKKELEQIGAESDGEMRLIKVQKQLTTGPTGTKKLSIALQAAKKYGGYRPQQPEHSTYHVELPASRLTRQALPRNASQPVNSSIPVRHSSGRGQSQGTSLGKRSAAMKEAVLPKLGLDAGLMSDDAAERELQSKDGRVSSSSYGASVEKKAPVSRKGDNILTDDQVDATKTARGTGVPATLTSDPDEPTSLKEPDAINRLKSLNKPPMRRKTMSELTH